MPEMNLIKNRLIDDLWIPTSLEGGKLFYPKLRKNKKMKILALTCDDNFNEVAKFIENKISQKGLITIWNYDRFKATRLDSEGIAGKVLGATRYEESIQGENHKVVEYFPFDILSLDFSSQDPEIENGRIEKEILGLEKTIKIQREKSQGISGFILLYTTLINSKELNCATIIENCGNIRVQGWRNGIIFNGIPEITTDYESKIRIIESVLNQLSSKYNFDIQLNRISIELENLKYIYSFAGIIKYRC